MPVQCDFNYHDDVSFTINKLVIDNNTIGVSNIMNGSVIISNDKFRWSV